MERKVALKVVVVLGLGFCFLMQSITSPSALSQTHARSKVVGNMLAQGTTGSKRLLPAATVEVAIAAAYILAAMYATLTDSFTRYASYYGGWYSAQSSAAAQSWFYPGDKGTLNKKTARAFDPPN